MSYIVKYMYVYILYDGGITCYRVRDLQTCPFARKNLPISVDNERNRKRFRRDSRFLGNTRRTIFPRIFARKIHMCVCVCVFSYV